MKIKIKKNFSILIKNMILTKNFSLTNKLHHRYLEFILLYLI